MDVMLRSIGEKIRDRLQVRLHRGFLERMQAVFHPGANPLTKRLNLPGEKSFQNNDHFSLIYPAMKDRWVFQLSSRPTGRHSGDAPIWMNREPKQTHQHNAQKNRAHSQRAKLPAVWLRPLSDSQFNVRPVAAP